MESARRCTNCEFAGLCPSVSEGTLLCKHDPPIVVPVPHRVEGRVIGSETVAPQMQLGMMTLWPGALPDGGCSKHRYSEAFIIGLVAAADLAGVASKTEGDNGS